MFEELDPVELRVDYYARYPRLASEPLYLQLKIGKLMAYQHF
jgi:hypothetical protein